MGAIAGLVLALSPIAEGLIAGKTIEAILVGFTLPEWVGLTAAILQVADPHLEAQLQSFAEKVDPHVADLIAKGKTEGAQAAAKAMFERFSQKNAEEAMKLQPGMGSGVAPNNY